MAATRMILGRRPSTGQQPFGHVALNTDAQGEIEQIVSAVLSRATASVPVTYDPDDTPQAGEVMTATLAGIDNEFQPAAPWSIERAAAEIAKPGRPTTISKADVAGGGWTFYLLRATCNGTNAIVVRATSPTRGLKHSNRAITLFVGGELRLVKDPLVGLDYDAEAVIADGTVYIFKPQRLERLLIDAEEVKARAPQIAAKFASGVSATLSTGAATWIETACSHNSNVGRRVERLNRTGALSSMTAVKLRAGLADAKLPAGTFGSNAAKIDVGSLDHAIALIDIAADLYYQPRFDAASRRVASFRRLT